MACTRLNHPYIATAYRLTTDGATVVYVSDTAPFTDILFEDEFVAGARPRSAADLPPPDRREAGPHARRGWFACARGPTWSSTTPCSPPEDYQRMPHYGHSRPTDAIEICREAGAQTLALYHHAPERTDAEIDAILADTRAAGRAAAPRCDVIAAYEGLDVNLARSPERG